MKQYRSTVGAVQWFPGTELVGFSVGTAHQWFCGGLEPCACMDSYKADPNYALTCPDGVCFEIEPGDWIVRTPHGWAVYTDAYFRLVYMPEDT